MLYKNSLDGLTLLTQTAIGFIMAVYIALCLFFLNFFYLSHGNAGFCIPAQIQIAAMGQGGNLSNEKMLFILLLNLLPVIIGLPLVLKTALCFHQAPDCQTGINQVTWYVLHVLFS